MIGIFASAPLCIHLFSIFNDVHQYRMLVQKMHRHMKRLERDNNKKNDNTARIAEAFKKQVDVARVKCCRMRYFLEGLAASIVCGLVLTVIEVKPVNCFVENATAVIFVSEAVLFTLYMYVQNVDICTQSKFSQLSESMDKDGDSDDDDKNGLGDNARAVRV